MIGLIFFAIVAALFLLLSKASPTLGGGSGWKRAAVVMAILLAYLFADPVGYLDMKLACAKEGGVRVKTISVEKGFFYEEPFTGFQCDACYEFVIDRAVDFVDFENKVVGARGGAGKGLLQGDAGTYGEYRLFATTTYLRKVSAQGSVLCRHKIDGKAKGWGAVRTDKV